MQDFYFSLPGDVRELRSVRAELAQHYDNLEQSKLLAMLEKIREETVMVSFWRAEEREERGGNNNNSITSSRN